MLDGGVGEVLGVEAEGSPAAVQLDLWALGEVAALDSTAAVLTDRPGVAPFFFPGSGICFLGRMDPEEERTDRSVAMAVQGAATVLREEPIMHTMVGVAEDSEVTAEAMAVMEELDSTIHTAAASLHWSRGCKVSRFTHRMD